MFGVKMLLGVVVSLLTLLTMAGGLWMHARETALEADQEVRSLVGDLEAARADQERLQGLLDAEREALAERDRLQEVHAAQLAEARRSLARIRTLAHEDGSNENLACAVRPVPGAVDELLRGPADDDARGVSTGDATRRTPERLPRAAVGGG